MNFLILIGMFASGVVTDVIWAMYITKLSEHKHLQAAIYSVGTGLVTIIFIEGMITNLYLTIPWLCGLFVGTFYSDTIESWIKSKIHHEK